MQRVDVDLTEENALMSGLWLSANDAVVRASPSPDLVVEYSHFFHP